MAYNKPALKKLTPEEAKAVLEAESIPDDEQARQLSQESFIRQRPNSKSEGEIDFSFEVRPGRVCLRQSRAARLKLETSEMLHAPADCVSLISHSRAESSEVAPLDHL